MKRVIESLSDGYYAGCEWESSQTEESVKLAWQKGLLFALRKLNLNNIIELLNDIDDNYETYHKLNKLMGDYNNIEMFNKN